MNFARSEARPGVVLKVCDNYGTIKASCLGIFSEEDDPELLPPMYQFIRISNTSFSKPHEGDAIWVWFDHSNPQEFLYTFRGDAKVHNADVLDEAPDDCEILSGRGDGESTLRYSDKDGWFMNNKESSLQIDANNKVTLNQNNSQHKIEVSDDGFKFITDGGTQEPAVLGTKLTECLQSLIQGLQKVAAAGKSDVHTTPMAVAIDGMLIEVNQKLNKILSKNTTLD